jgi:hypothetical protein
MNTKKRLLLFAVPAAVLGIGAGGVAFTVMAVKDQTYIPSAPLRPEASLTPRSRSSTTRVRVTRKLRRARSRTHSTRPSPGSARTTPAASRASGRPSPTPPIRVEPINLIPAAEFPRVADLDVPPGDAALGLSGAGGANGKTGDARNDRQQPLRAGRDRLIREAGRGAWRPPCQPCLPASRPHLLAEEPRGLSLRDLRISCATSARLFARTL